MPDNALNTILILLFGVPFSLVILGPLFFNPLENDPKKRTRFKVWLDANKASCQHSQSTIYLHTFIHCALFILTFSVMGYLVNMVINWPAIALQWGLKNHIPSEYTENYRLVRNLFIFVGLAIGAVSALIKFYFINPSKAPQKATIRKDRSNLN